MIRRGLMTFRYIPTGAAEAAFGSRLEPIAAGAIRAILRAGRGFDVAHLQFRRGRDLVAVRSRTRPSGELEVEIDVGNPQLPAVVFTEAEMRAADRQSRDRARGARRATGPVFHLAP